VYRSWVKIAEIFGCSNMGSGYPSWSLGGNRGSDLPVVVSFRPAPRYGENKNRTMIRPLLLGLLLLVFGYSWAQESASANAPLVATNRLALLNVVVTDFQAKPRNGEMIFFESAKSGKSVSRKTDAAGKFQILLPKGDTYKIKYQGFLDQKESSTIEVPEEEGIMEATLTVQMEDESAEVYELDVHFETGKAVIRPESYGVLDELVGAMKRLSASRIELAGHTDSDGSVADNLKLSRDRAAAVRGYLIGKGIGAGRIEAVGYGEAKPVAGNETEAGKARNRRTEVRVIE
jgi:outer membrane protein OmpA-like peptidoglycan-associated protein